MDHTPVLEVKDGDQELGPRWMNVVNRRYAADDVQIKMFALALQKRQGEKDRTK